MLTAEEIAAIEAEFPRYEQKRAVCIDALKIVQRRRGWVSDEVLTELAQFLDMTTDELDSVATFYDLIFRKPVGRHVILMCDSVSCWIMGYDLLLERLQEHLGIGFGQTTADNRFTLLPSACLGACDRAPVMMIDKDLHLDVDPHALAEILERYE